MCKSPAVLLENDSHGEFPELQSTSARAKQKEALTIRSSSSCIHLPVSKLWCGHGFIICKHLKVPPKSPKNPPTMANLRVAFARNGLDLLTRAIYKLLVWSVRNVRLTSTAIQTSARAAAQRSGSHVGLLATCGGIINRDS